MIFFYVLYFVRRHSFYCLLQNASIIVHACMVFSSYFIRIINDWLFAFLHVQIISSYRRLLINKPQQGKLMPRCGRVGHWTLYAVRRICWTSFGCESVPCMHHRALCRLQQTASLTLNGSPSFTHLLQAAARRAWTRRVSSFSAMSTKASRQQINQGSSRSYGKSVCKSEITPENVRKHGSTTR